MKARLTKSPKPLTPDFAAKPWYGPNLRDARIAALESRYNGVQKRCNDLQATCNALWDAIKGMGPLKPSPSDKKPTYEDRIPLPRPHERQQ